MQIRPATIQDTQPITNLLIQLGYQDAPANVQKRLTLMCQQDDAMVLVALDNHNRVIGCTQIVVANRLAEGLYGEITSLVIDAASRGTGIGAKLVRAAETWLQSKDIDRVRVKCNAKRERAQRFYLKLGFRQTKRQIVFDRCLERSTSS